MYPHKQGLTPPFHMHTDLGDRFTHTHTHHTYTHTHTHTPHIHTHMHTHTHTTHTHTCTHTQWPHTQAHTNTRLALPTFAHRYLTTIPHSFVSPMMCVLVLVCVCACVYMYFTKICGHEKEGLICYKYALVV